MKGYAKFYIEKIENFLKSKGAFAEIILIGGLAMEFYGSSRYTTDIDGEIQCSEEIYFELIDFLKNEKLSFNLSENISGWGIIPLPEGYRKRAKTVYETENLRFKILDPLDFIFSKLLRGTEEDFSDIIKIVEKYKISKDEILKRANLIKYPKDPETLFFRKKLQYLISKISHYETR